MSKNKLSNNSLYLLYFALFHSHFVYANIIWSCTDSSTINSIFKLQKKAIRLISGSKFNAHTEPLFKKLEILPLPDLISYFKLQFMHRFVNSLLPASFHNMWQSNQGRLIGVNLLQLRNNTDITVPFARLEITKKLPLTNFPTLWNNFNEN